MKGNTPAINFIKHFLDINEVFRQDLRLSPFHISLYNSLFLEWNHCGFQNPISVSRGELMSMSKIGSINSYTKTLKELNEFGYLEYKPSFNRFIGSKIIMYTFSKGCDKACDNGCSKGCDKALTMPLIPYTNYIKLKETIKTNKTYESKKEIFKEKIPQIKVQEKNQEVLFLLEENKKPIPKKILHSFPQNIEEVQSYFSEKKFPPEEAAKFYYHFEANGWLVAGKTKMQKWKAAAIGWVLRYDKFKNQFPKEPKPNNLHVNQDKDYSIPL